MMKKALALSFALLLPALAHAACDEIPAATLLSELQLPFTVEFTQDLAARPAGSEAAVFQHGRYVNELDGDLSSITKGEPDVILFFNDAGAPITAGTTVHVVDGQFAFPDERGVALVTDGANPYQIDCFTNVLGQAVTVGDITDGIGGARFCR